MARRKLTKSDVIRGRDSIHVNTCRLRRVIMLVGGVTVDSNYSNVVDVAVRMRVSWTIEKR